MMKKENTNRNIRVTDRVNEKEAKWLKEAAWRETYRVLKPNGLFCGCFYVEVENAHTDRYIRRFYVKRGFFTPPFETKDSLRTRLEGKYAEVETGTVQSIAWFRCVK